VGEFFFETLVRSPQAVAREKAEQEQLESQGSVGLPTRFNTPEFAPRDMQSIGPDYFVGGHWR
jgi:hypothetical protein